MVVAGVLLIRRWVRATDYRALARRIERKHPELDGILITAVQQEVKGGAERSYLEHRLLQEATARSQAQDWRDIVPRPRLWAWTGLHALAAVMFLLALGGLRITPVLGEKPAWVSREGVAVTPGDTAIEKGESLVVLARFSGALPP